MASKTVTILIFLTRNFKANRHFPELSPCRSSITSHCSGKGPRSFRTAVLRKSFNIGFSYKHCNLSRVCLLVKMASKTVTILIFLTRNFKANRHFPELSPCRSSTSHCSGKGPRSFLEEADNTKPKRGKSKQFAYCDYKLVVILKIL